AVPSPVPDLGVGEVLGTAGLHEQVAEGDVDPHLSLKLPARALAGVANMGVAVIARPALEGHPSIGHVDESVPGDAAGEPRATTANHCCGESGSVQGGRSIGM